MDRAFCIAITDADIGSLKFLYILFGKYLGNMLVKFEQIRMVGHIQTFELSGKHNNHSEESVGAILEEVPVTLIIV